MLSTRRTEYGVREAAGWTWYANEKFAIRATEKDLLLAVRKCNPPKEIPDSYWTGTARHESSLAVNERDTEKTGFRTYGVFKVSVEEGQRAGVPADELATLKGCAQAFVPTATRNYLYLLPYATTVEARERDIFAYMAVLHNVGPNDSSINNVVSGKHPLYWGRRRPDGTYDGFQGRNQSTDWGRAIIAYGNDCLPKPVVGSTPSVWSALFSWLGGR